MNGRVAALAVAAAALVLAGVGAAGIRSDEDRTRPERRPGGPPADASEVEREIDEVKAFVARTRGHEFVADVKVELLTGDAFRGRLLADAEEEREETENDEHVLRALGLLEPGIDLHEVVLAYFSDSVVGFYDVETNELVVRTTELTPYARATLAHELTHALDDQLFELHRPELEDAEDEALFALRALVEGNAIRVQDAYEATMSPAETRQLAEEEEALAAGIDVDEVPMFIQEIFAFPYTVGPVFLDALVEAGGERRVDDAFNVPPTTSEHVIDPLAWFDGEGILEVSKPAPEGEVIDEGSYGLWALLLTLADALDFDEAGQAAEGWGGDSYVAWLEGERACVRAVFAMDTARDLDELSDALDLWADDHGDATVTRQRNTVGFTACG